MRAADRIGDPALHRFRVGLAFALSGHREVDGMIGAVKPLADSATRVARGVAPESRLVVSYGL